MILYADKAKKYLKLGIAIFALLKISVGYSAAISSQKQSLSHHIKIPVEKYRLANGLRVLLNPDSSVDMVSYALGFIVGGRHERAEKSQTGLSHMFEHMMFRGTKRYPEFSETFIENGVIGSNAITTKDNTFYFAVFPSDKLELVLDMESDRMVHLELDVGLLETEKKSVLEERLLRVDSHPEGPFTELFFETIFEKHPYRQPVIGYKKDIKSYSIEDVKTWYKTYYSPNNAVLVLSGKFSVAKAKRLIKKYFGSIPSKTLPKEEIVKEPKQKAERIDSIKRKGQFQTVVSLGYKIPGIRNLKERIALSIVCEILGAGEYSRLYKKLVRDTQIVPTIDCYIISLDQYGVLSINYTLSNQTKEHIVKNLVLKEIEKLKSESVTAEEMERIKNLTLNYIIGNLMTNISRSSLLMGNEIAFGDWKKIYDIVDTIDSVSEGFIKESVNRYLNPYQLSYVTLTP